MGGDPLATDATPRMDATPCAIGSGFRYRRAADMTVWWVRIWGGVGQNLADPSHPWEPLPTTSGPAVHGKPVRGARRIEAVNFAASTRRIFRSKDLITSRMPPLRPQAHPDPRS